MNARLVDRRRADVAHDLGPRGGVPLAALVVSVGLTLSGCATVSFKSGATPGNMEADENACRKVSESGEKYAKCMRDRGWYLFDPKDDSKAPPVDRGVVEAVPPPPTPVAALPLPTVVPVSGAAGASGTPLAVATPDPSRGVPALDPEPPVEVVVPAAVTPPVPAALPTAEAVEVATPLDPMTPMDVASWWKLFAGPSDLDRAIAACAKRLGPAHEAESGARVVTKAMYDCLREAGWRPLGGAGAK